MKPAIEILAFVLAILFIFEPAYTKDQYTIGGLAITGSVRLFQQWNSTFSTYLTLALRQNPKFANITFKLVSLDFYSTFTMVEQNAIDFVYTNPSIYSCLESEFQLTSLATLRNLALGKEVNVFGGVIFSKAGSGIKSLDDVRGRRVALSSLAALGAGQMQWRVLSENGIELMTDPSQVIIVGNSQQTVVQLVHQGLADIGFVRTNQIESMAASPPFQLPGPPGTAGTVPTTMSLFQLINASYPPYAGGAFPFPSSTQLYPEWNLGAMPSVEWELQTAVQRALFNINQAGTGDSEAVRAASVKAASDGRYKTWQPSVSYMTLRTMQEQIGYIRNDNGQMRCIRADDSAVYQAISCPSGHFKKSQAQVFTECSRLGLQCPSPAGVNLTCICSPCYKANAVELYPPVRSALIVGSGVRADGNSTLEVPACQKMETCFQANQNQPITLALIDNMQRRVINASYRLRTTVPLSGVAVANGSAPGVYTLTFQTAQVGMQLLLIFVDGVEIINSPYLVDIIPRDCEKDYGVSSHRTADAAGFCVCEPVTLEIGGKCVGMETFIPAVVLPTMAALFAAVYMYILFERRKSDSLWVVRFAELRFDSPPLVLGRGTFGQVLQAEYRGTSVAVKRVLPTGAEATAPFFGAANPRQQTKDAAVRAALAARVAAGPSSTSTMIQDPSHVTSELITLAPFATSPVPRLHNFEGGGSGPGKADGTGSMEGGSVGKLLGSQKGPRSNTHHGADGQNRGGFSSAYRTQSAPPEPGAGSVLSVAASNSSMNASGNGSLRRRPAGTRRGSVLHSMRLSFVDIGSKVLGEEFKERQRISDLRRDFVEEMRTLSKLRHPCITTVMGAVTGEEKGTEPMLIMELMDHGSLYDLLHNETIVLEGDILLPILRDIVQGMRFLHAAQPAVIHGDLKAANVLVDTTFRAKVSDFGLSQKKKMGACGTPCWMAPELLAGGFPSQESDVYAFGIMLYEIFSRKNPYQEELEDTPLDALLREVRDNPNCRPLVPSGTPAAVESMMIESWAHDPQDRPRFEALDVRVKHLDVGGITRLALDQVKKSRREEAVLYDVFPRHIADALVAGRKVEPEAKEVVTIFFSDIAGFTTISSTLPPEKVSMMLDRLYHRFDELSVQHGVFKVETIGDAWMGVTNLVEDQAGDHAARIARFALGAMNAAYETPIDLDDPSVGTVHIRVGFHSGPVVANVVGTRAPRYCLFGDTVNTASRMESNSVEGRIHCSDRAAAILSEQAPSMQLEPRGFIEVKGKGKMSTFWLNGEGPQSNDINHPASSPSSPIRNNGVSDIDFAPGHTDNAMPEPERPVIVIEGAHALTSSVNCAVAAMPELSSQPPDTVARKRRSSILEYLGLWRPYAANGGGDVGVFPA
mmetsp:Transcript_51963/g.108521  ORF Transcript_51963/g.108521 Transcript_51963/m.108521 type:complete len:1378 (-) Transcript_51963:103-4236(-)